MSRAYGRIAFTPGVRELQARSGSPVVESHEHRPAPGDPLGDFEADFLAEQDSFYLATVGSTGWPYVQFRGGPPGFLHVLDPHTVAWADVGGNLQYISMGNLATDDRVAMIVLDQARRMRLKLFGHAGVWSADDTPELVDRVTPAEWLDTVERVVSVTVVAYDWNCPDHITPRYTEAQVRQATSSLQQQVERLSAENAELRRLARSAGRD